MVKKIMVTLIAVFILGVLAIGFTVFNLKSNSVYYAQHTPHKPGTEPVLIELVDNLSSAYTPDLKGIKYDYDGGNAIVSSADRNEKSSSWFGSFEQGKYQYDSIDNVSYQFDERFHLVFALKGVDELNLNSVNVDQVKRDIYKLVQPVIDAQPKPWVNLQWIYDWINHDRFN